MLNVSPRPAEALLPRFGPKLVQITEFTLGRREKSHVAQTRASLLP